MKFRFEIDSSASTNRRYAAQRASHYAAAKPWHGEVEAETQHHRVCNGRPPWERTGWSCGDSRLYSPQVSHSQPQLLSGGGRV